VTIADRLPPSQSRTSISELARSPRRTFAGSAFNRVVGGDEKDIRFVAQQFDLEVVHDRNRASCHAQRQQYGITETKLILVGLFVLVPVKYVEHLLGSLRLGFGFVSGSRCLKHQEMCKNEMFRGETSRNASTVKNHPADEDRRRVLDTAQRLFHDLILAVEIISIALVAEISARDHAARSNIENANTLFIRGKIPKIKFGNKVMLFVVGHRRRSNHESECKLRAEMTEAEISLRHAKRFGLYLFDQTNRHPSMKTPRLQSPR